MTSIPTHKIQNGEVVELTQEEKDYFSEQWNMEVPVPIPGKITARQFLIQLAVSGIISPEESLAAAQGGIVPAAIDAVFDTLPAPQASGARITWARMTEVPRDDPLFLVAGPVLELTPEFIDQFFIDAASIP